MDDPFEPESSLLEVSNKGMQLVASITKYLSTLPHPIDIIEELVAVCSVTSNLLATLDSTITRFQPTTSPRASFIKPLCHDILVAFAQFAQKVGDAQRFSVFEPNNVGLVRVPRNAWAYVMGGEVKMAQFRSRLYVEKYRVRVLIDAVAWQGLKAIGPLGRTAEQERELEALRKMLPLVAERLLGVWRDYKPRIENGGVTNAQFLPPLIREQQKLPVVVTVKEKQHDLKKEVNASSGKLGFHSSPSSTSIASDCSSRSTSSSVTVTDACVYERWLLRRSEAQRDLLTKSYVLGLPVKSTYKHDPAHHYIKPLSSHSSEIQSLISLQIATGSSISKAILSLPDDAQCEIQKLIESRENASSNNNTKRSFEIIAFQPQPRRKISPLTPSKYRKWWNNSEKKGLVEWVIVLKGETVDQKTRTTPAKHEDPWNSKLEVPPVAPKPTPLQRPIPTLLQQQQLQQMAAAQMAAARNGNNTAPGAHVLRHVEQRRGFSPEEAEQKMGEILRDLFKIESEKGETRGEGGVAKYTSD